MGSSRFEADPAKRVRPRAPRDVSGGQFSSGFHTLVLDDSIRYVFLWPVETLSRAAIGVLA
jgi:hypothetical protein